MSKEKRRDSKGRILRTGESQRKDGRYAYKYVNTLGETKFEYAWKLTVTDKTPAGKKEDDSLREKELKIQKDLADGIDTIGGKMRVWELYAKFIRHRKSNKRKTKQGRNHLLNLLKNDPLGIRSIDSIKMSDAKEWAIRMSDNGFAYKTISNYKRSLKATFYTAIEDDCIRKNPFNYDLSTVLEDDTKPKEILTPEQEKNLLAFMEQDKVYQKYRDEVIILLGTGLRVSEFCGLNRNVLDFKDKSVNVMHQLLKDSEIGYYIETPKTKSGVRQIPMTEEVCQAFKRVLKKRGKVKTIAIDGYNDFLFLNQKGEPKTAGNYESMVRGLIKKYNKCHDEQLPHITPHTFRHTFCTNLANAGMNPKALQYIMGHSNINMTLNYYAHATYASAKEEMERLIA